MIQKMVRKRRNAKTDRIRYERWIEENEARMAQVLSEMRQTTEIG